MDHTYGWGKRTHGRKRMGQREAKIFLSHAVFLIRSIQLQVLTLYSNYHVAVKSTTAGVLPQAPPFVAWMS